MTEKISLLQEVRNITSLIGGLGSDAIVAKTASVTKPKAGAPVELTKFTLAPGSWIIAGQASFSVSGAEDSQIEYQLSLGYSSGTTPVAGGRNAYLRLPGGAFGSPIVIDAIVLDRVTTVRLLYLTQIFPGSPSSYPPGPDVRDQILIAIKTSDLLVYTPRP